MGGRGHGLQLRAGARDTPQFPNARMAQQVDAGDLKSSAARLAGSNPAPGTSQPRNAPPAFLGSLAVSNPPRVHVGRGGMDETMINARIEAARALCHCAISWPAHGFQYADLSWLRCSREVKRAGIGPTPRGSGLPVRGSGRKELKAPHAAGRAVLLPAYPDPMMLVAPQVEALQRTAQRVASHQELARLGGLQRSDHHWHHAQHALGGGGGEGPWRGRVLRRIPARPSE